ncbi:MAG: flagellar M-ring protein FliF, partial [Nitrospirales bacterium]|nr:flagellar M-ring protein FliF [Nitrospirales bacterium]
MAKIIENIKNMPLRNKIILLVSVVLAVAVVVFALSWIQKADYQVLYANLSESDAGSVVQKLKELKVPYRIEAGSITVPSDKVYDLRLQLAAQGIPQGGGIGFELFDKTDFGTTDFVQKLNYRRALQGELGRTIMALSEVEQCRVHLAIPEKSLFVQEGNSPSASVLVKLRPGRTLSQGQIQGIVHLVSSSIEGLNPRAVTVVDSHGEMLTRPADSDMAGLSSSQLEFQRSYEKEMESRILGILEPVVGKNKVRAKVTAALDFTKTEKTEEKYDPDSQVVRSEQKNIERSASGGSGGIAGVGSNLPGKGGQTSSSQSGSQKQHETINYEISKVVSHSVNSAGELKRLSVAVIVDGAYIGREGAKERKYAPRSEDDIRRYEELVKNAVGFTSARGDEVRVVNMPFESLPQEEAGEEQTSYMPIILTALKYAVPVLALLLFFLFVIRPLIGAVASAPFPLAQTTGTASGNMSFPQRVGEIEKSLETKALPLQPDVIEWAKKNPEQA